MKIQVLYNRQYIPFDLYINSIYKIFKSNIFFTSKNCDVSIINNISLYDSESTFLLLFLNDIHLIYNIDTNKTKIIFINADYILNYSHNDYTLVYNYINLINLENTYIWEYNILNIAFYNKNFQNNKVHFIPLLYNDYLENVYIKNKLNICHNDKPIDVLFLGNISPRREKLLNEINKKCKLIIMENNQNIDEYINIIEKSKIVLNIYSKEINMPFDYYRFSLLYSNKVFVITEKISHTNMDIEKNLLELNELIINVDYDNIVNEIENYLNKTDEEIKIIKEKTYETFKKYDMNNYIVDFFTNV
jgi:hypothetical protein